MIYQNVEFHNFDGFFEDDEFKGAIRLQRVPEEIRLQLNPGAQARTLAAANGEIRFVADAKVTVTLSCVEGTCNIFPAFGDFLTNQRIEVTQEPITIDLEPKPRLQELSAELAGKCTFATSVIRLLTFGGQLRFHGIEGIGVRPPAEAELAKLRYLAYGTSITHGAAASAPQCTYVSQLAQRLKADLINLGMGGSCHCENAFADYVAGRTDWDVATLALSVNMIGARFSLDEFYDRVYYLIDKVAVSNPARPIFCITIYPHFRDLGMPDNSKDNPPKGTPEQYREKLREAVKNCGHANVHLLEGPDILQDISGLTPDLIHPSDIGMTQMAENLAKHIKPVLAANAS